MYQVTVDYAKKNLDELCDRATQESEGVAIVRENQSYVLITQEEWESLKSDREVPVLVNEQGETIVFLTQFIGQQLVFELGTKTLA